MHDTRKKLIHLQVTTQNHYRKLRKMNYRLKLI